RDWAVGMPQHCDRGRLWQRLMHKSEALWSERQTEAMDARGIAARPIETRDEAEPDGIVADGKRDRNRAGGRFGGERRRGALRRCDQRHLTLHQIGSERGKAVVAFLGPA